MEKSLISRILEMDPAARNRVNVILTILDYMRCSFIVLITFYGIAILKY